MRFVRWHFYRELKMTLDDWKAQSLRQSLEHNLIAFALSNHCRAVRDSIILLNWTRGNGDWRWTMDDGAIQLLIPPQEINKKNNKNKGPIPIGWARTKFFVPHCNLLQNLHMVFFELMTSVWHINIQSQVSKGVWEYEFLLYKIMPAYEGVWAYLQILSFVLIRIVLGL